VSEEIVYLSRQEVADLLPPVLDQVDLVERTYRAMARGRVELPPKPGVHPREDAFIHAMPAYLADDDVASLKWVSGYPANKRRGLPYISGLIVVNDADTGFPVAVMDAGEITAARTAAASGTCMRRWAPKGWSTVAILGCGEQGRYHARVVAALNGDATIQAYDLHPERARALDGRVDVALDARTAVDGAEIVITGTPILKQADPCIDSDWLGDRYLALPLDFDAQFQEGPIADAGLFASDDVTQFEYYRSLGHFQGWPAPHASVGQALESGRQAKRVACCNLGVGALDAAFAKAVLDAALVSGVGARLPR
jgi:ornithine cyclodeaminase/alanine dehydrogenase-like protein (mu-crystallin family)